MWNLLVVLVQSFFIYRIYKVLQVLYRPLLLHWVYPKLGWVVNLEPYKNLWTVVTGCTDGIGKAYTEELARRGFRKFILISRDINKLNNMSQYLRSKYKVEIQICKFDFTNKDYTPVSEFLSSFHDVGILVNNVGISVGQFANFLDQADGVAEDIMWVNAMSVVKMCQMVLPRMVHRNQGIIINIASILGWKPVPLISTYSCSKAFVSFLSECLHLEYNRTNVRIQCLLPLVVATRMSTFERKEANEIIIVTPETYAKQAVDVIGNHHMTPGCIAHALQMACLAFLPFCILKHLLVPFLKQIQTNRMKTIQKMKELQPVGKS